MQGKEGRRKIGLVPENIEDKDRKGTIEDSGKNEAIHVLVFPEGKARDEETSFILECLRTVPGSKIREQILLEKFTLLLIALMRV